MLKNSVLILLLIFSLVAQSQELKYSREDLRPLEDSFTEKIKLSLIEYLGKDIRFSVNVKLDIDFPESQAASNEAYQDAGYLVVPKVSSNTSGPNFFKIKGTKVYIYFYEENYSSDIKENIKIIVNSVTGGRGFKSNVIFNFIKAPAVKSKEKAPEIIVPKEEDGWTKIFKNYGLALSLLLGLAFIALTLLFSAIIFSKFFRSSFQSLSETLRYSQQQKAELPAAKMIGQSRSEIPLAGGLDVPATFERNVRVVKNVLQSSAHTFARTMSESEGDFLGLKKLIPVLMDGDEGIIHLIGDKTIKAMEEKTSGQTFSEAEFYSWLGSFVERLTFHYVKKGTPYTKLLEAKIFHALLEVNFDLMMNYALDRNSPTVFRLVMDLLPPSVAQDFLNKFTADHWRVFLTEDQLDPRLVNNAAKEMLAHAQEMKAQGGRGQSKEIFDEVLVSPLVGHIFMKPLKEVDEFMRQIEDISPEICGAVLGKVWPPYMLENVPADHLAKKVKSLSFEEREYVLSALPPESAEHLFNFVPEGKMKGVLKDQLQKNAKSYSKDRALVAERLGRQFIATLHREYSEGHFELESSPANKKVIEKIAA